MIPDSKVIADLNYFIEAVDQTGQRATYSDKGQAQPFVLTVATDNEPPVLALDRVTSAPAAKPLTINAEVRDPSAVKSVRLRYRSRHKDYHALDMPGGYSWQTYCTERRHDDDATEAHSGLSFKSAIKVGSSEVRSEVGEVVGEN